MGERATWRMPSIDWRLKADWRKREREKGREGGREGGRETGESRAARDRAVGPGRRPRAGLAALVRPHRRFRPDPGQPSESIIRVNQPSQPAESTSRVSYSVKPGLG